MTPIVNGLEKEFAGQVAVIRLNAQEAEVTQLMNNYGIRGHPSFVILDDTNEVTQRLIGSQTEEGLREAIAAVTIGE